MILVSDGTVYKENLKLLGRDESYLQRELSRAGIRQISQVFLWFSDENRRLHVYPKGESRNGIRKEISPK